MAHTNLAVDGAEAKLLLAELEHFVLTLGLDEMQRRAGRRFDRSFRFWDVLSYPGPQFDVRIVPTAALEHVLAALWAQT